MKNKPVELTTDSIFYTYNDLSFYNVKFLLHKILMPLTYLVLVNHDHKSNITILLNIRSFFIYDLWIWKFDVTYLILCTVSRDHFLLFGWDQCFVLVSLFFGVFMLLAHPCVDGVKFLRRVTSSHWSYLCRPVPTLQSKKRREDDDEDSRPLSPSTYCTVPTPPDTI